MKGFCAKVRGCAGFLAACLLAGCGTRVHAAATTDTWVPAHSLFVARRSWHIDVGFAVDELAGPLSSVAALFPGVRYVFFGFGDRRYLTAKHHGAPVLLLALWPGPGMVLVTALRATPAAAFGDAHVVELSLTRPASLRAQSFIWQALADSQKSALSAGSSGSGAPIGLPGPYPGSLFLDSGTTYSAVHTCNTWAAEVLKAAEMPVHSRGIVFAAQLWRQVARLKPFPRDAADATGLAAGWLGSVLTHDDGTGVTRHDDSGALFRRRRTTAADATGQQAGQR